MNVAKQVKAIQARQQKLVKLQDDIKTSIQEMTKPVEKYLKKRFKDEFPEANFYFLSSFHCGSLTDKWQPQVFLYRVNGLSLSSEGYWYDELDREGRKQSSPVATRRLLSFLKTLSEEIGVKVTLMRHKSYWLDMKDSPVV